MGEGTDVRAQAVSGEGRREGAAATVPPELGRPRKETRGGEGEGERASSGSWASRPELRKGGGEKKKAFFFLFSRVLANHFQIDFVSNSNLIKTNHYKNKGAAACMHQEVTNLIFDFNFTIFIIFLYLNARIIG